MTITVPILIPVLILLIPAILDILWLACILLASVHLAYNVKKTIHDAQVSRVSHELEKDR